MQRIGFIGLGLMGHGMAKNLLKKGHPLSFLVHRNRANLADLLDLKATEVKTPARAGARTPTSSSCASPARRRSRPTCTGTACSRAARKGQIVIDCSTAMPESTDRIRADFEKKGVRFVDAPLARTPQHAEEGKLNCMVGADAATFAEVKPVLEKFCENIFHVGGPGAGHKIKLVYNFVAMGHAAITCEALAACAQGRHSPGELLPAGLGRRRQLEHVPDAGAQGAQGRPHRPAVHARQREEGHRLLPADGRGRSPRRSHGQRRCTRCWCRRTRSASARSSSRP